LAATTIRHTATGGTGRLHAFLVAAAMPLFVGSLLNDWAYWSSYEIQWSNFASWLLAGGLVFIGIALVVALADLLRARDRGDRRLGRLVLLLGIVVVGFINALVHARDAWAVMPAGLVLSIAVAVLATIAAWLAFADLAASPADTRDLP
jgi:uncharacterized membrane protein